MYCSSYFLHPLNGNLDNALYKNSVIKKLGRTTSSTGTISSPELANYNMLAVVVSVSGWSKTEVFMNTGSYITEFINGDAGNIRIRMDYSSNKITLSGFVSSGGVLNACDVYGLFPK